MIDGRKFVFDAVAEGSGHSFGCFWYGYAQIHWGGHRRPGYASRRAARSGRADGHARGFRTGRGAGFRRNAGRCSASLGAKELLKLAQIGVQLRVGFSVRDLAYLPFVPSSAGVASIDGVVRIFRQYLSKRVFFVWGEFNYLVEVLNGGGAFFGSDGLRGIKAPIGVKYHRADVVGVLSAKFGESGL